MNELRCKICKVELAPDEAYEYRGMVSCEAHFDQVIEKRDIERAEEVAKQDAETRRFKGLDFGDSPIGKVNREIFDL